MRSYENFGLCVCFNIIAFRLLLFFSLAWRDDRTFHGEGLSWFMGTGNCLGDCHCGLGQCGIRENPRSI